MQNQKTELNKIPLNPDIPNYFKSEKEYNAFVKTIPDANGNKFKNTEDLIEKTLGNSKFAENNLTSFLDGLTRLIVEQIVPIYADVVDPLERFERPSLIVGNGYQEIALDLTHMEALDNNILIPNVATSTQTNQVYNHPINFAGEKSIIFQYADLQLAVTAISRVNEIINRYINYLYKTYAYDQFVMAVKLFQTRVKNKITLNVPSYLDLLLNLKKIARNFKFPKRTFNIGFNGTVGPEPTLTPIISTESQMGQIIPIFTPDLEMEFNRTYASLYNQIFINASDFLARPMILPINENQEALPAVLDDLKDPTTGLPNSILLISEDAFLKARQFTYTAPMTWKNGQMTYTFTVRSLTDFFIWRTGVVIEYTVTPPPTGNTLIEGDGITIETIPEVVAKEKSVENGKIQNKHQE